MTDHERTEQLTAENTHLRAELQRASTVIVSLQARIAELEARLGKDSQNSSKPPASDGLRRRPRPQRTRGEKRSGGQIGHEGHTLERCAQPDERIFQHPATCQHCGADLRAIDGRVVERRQVFEMPVVRLQVREYVQERVCCPQCHHQTTGSFPTEASSLVQYGPRLRAWVVYLRMQHCLSVDRTSEAIAALTGAALAEGTILAWEQDASQAVAPAVEEVRQALRQEALLHADETGLHLGKRLLWVHVHATARLTLLQWHRKRGAEGMRSLGVLPVFHGTVIHDRWESYWQFACQHALCHAHLQRDLQGVWETTQQAWAKDLKDLFLAMRQATQDWSARGGIPPDEQADWEAAFWRLLDQGETDNPRTTGRKRTAAQNLVRGLRDHHVEVLAFLRDLSIPFTNNQAERDLRMLKVQQKIAGCCRSEAGATALCRLRSAISCLRKQGRAVLAVLTDALAGRHISLLPVSA